MPIAYKNRRGEIHYFKASKTKTGKYRYYVTKKADRDSLDNIPDGFEIYEHPEEATVVIRKKVVNKIKPEETDVISQAVKEFSNIKDFIVDANGNSVTIYIGRIKKEEFSDDFQHPKELEEFLMKNQSYIPKMRFVLTDETARTFTVQRWCYLGDTDDWIDLKSSDDIQKLAKDYTYHLGRDSYFDLEPLE